MIVWLLSCLGGSSMDRSLQQELREREEKKKQKKLKAQQEQKAAQKAWLEKNEGRIKEGVVEDLGEQIYLAVLSDSMMKMGGGHANIDPTTIQAAMTDDRCKAAAADIEQHVRENPRLEGIIKRAFLQYVTYVADGDEDMYDILVSDENVAPVVDGVLNIVLRQTPLKTIIHGVDSGVDRCIIQPIEDAVGSIYNSWYNCWIQPWVDRVNCITTHNPWVRLALILLNVQQGKISSEKARPCFRDTVQELKRMKQL